MAVQEATGGRGANQAVAAARLGARTALVARVGNDLRGALVLERLRAEGVDTRHVIRDPHAATGIAHIDVDAHGENQTRVASGANAHLSERDIQSAIGMLRDTRIVIAQLDPPLDTVLATARAARASGALFLLDPAPASPLPDELLAMVHLIKPNSHEAEVLSGIHVDDRASARAAAKQLLTRGADAVAVQAGEEGNLLVWRHGTAQLECWLPKLPVPTVDVTGAGDALIAALAVELADGRSLNESGPFASAAAALATTVLGAQAALPSRSMVLGLLAQTEARCCR